MSRVWKLDRRQYDSYGQLPLYRGDSWAVSGTVVDRVNGYETLVDMSLYSVTGFFPSNLPPCCTGTPAPISVPGVTGSCGVVVAAVQSTVTPNAELTTEGQGVYLVLEDQYGNIQTVPTSDNGVVILDRGMDLNGY